MKEISRGEIRSLLVLDTLYTYHITLVWNTSPIVIYYSIVSHTNLSIVKYNFNIIFIYNFNYCMFAQFTIANKIHTDVSHSNNLQYR